MSASAKKLRLELFPDWIQKVPKQKCVNLVEADVGNAVFSSFFETSFYFFRDTLPALKKRARKKKLENEDLFAKNGINTTKKEPSKVCYTGLTPSTYKQL